MIPVTLNVNDVVIVTKNLVYDKYNGLGKVIEIKGKEALVGCTSGNYGVHPFSSWFHLRSLFLAPKPATKD